MSEYEDQSQALAAPGASNDASGTMAVASRSNSRRSSTASLTRHLERHSELLESKIQLGMENIGKQILEALGDRLGKIENDLASVTTERQTKREPSNYRQPSFEDETVMRDAPPLIIPPPNHAPAPIPPPVVISAPKIPGSLFSDKAIQTYSGDRKDGACERWCIEMRQYIDRARMFQADLSESLAISIVAQYQRGSVSKWYSHLWQNNEIPSTLDGYLVLLLTRFSDLNTMEKRREAYEELKQGNRSFNDYWIDFDQSLTFLSPQPDAYERLRQMKKGMKPSLKDEMELRHADITDYRAYATQADKIDTAWSRKKERKELREKAQSRSTTSSTHTTDDRKCYNCNQVGHLSRNCPLKRTSEKEKTSLLTTTGNEEVL